MAPKPTLSLLILLVLATVVRFYKIGDAPLWGDELFSWLVSFLSPGRIVSYLALGNNPPLWELLLHFWRQMAGDSEAALRALSALFSVASAGVLYVWVRSTGGEWAGWTAALAWIFSTLGQSVGREARAYALLSLLVVLSHLFFLRWIAQKKSPWAWILTGWFLFHTHYMSIWVFLGQGIALLVWWRHSLRSFLVPACTLLMGIALQLIVLMDRLHFPEEIGYVPPSSIEGLYNMVWKFSNMPVPTVIGLGVVLMGIGKVVRHRRTVSPAVKYAFVNFPGVFLLGWLISMELRLWNARYFIPLAMAYYAVLGLSLAMLPKVARVLLAGALGVSWILSWNPVPPTPAFFHREMATLLQKKPHHHLLLVSPAYQSPILIYYPREPLCWDLIHKSIKLMPASPRGVSFSTVLDPIGKVSECLYSSAKVLGVNYYGEIPPCELQAADTIWWLDYATCFSYPHTGLPDLLWEEFEPKVCWEVGPGVRIWVATRRPHLPE
uniref:Hypothetical conserved protein n=1 Tax=uncultured Bacteroidota bacterium TaxID=152509 RepID=H5SMQ7_9BACT|nr:hypothetical conserved protein [uncultured Bacteroidetes bacterium]